VYVKSVRHNLKVSHHCNTCKSYLANNTSHLMCKYVQDLSPYQSSHALPCSNELLVIDLKQKAATLFYSLHKYFIPTITYFSKAYNQATFEDLKVRGTSLTSLCFHHVVLLDCRKLNSMALDS
jgi:hypothetical protein